MPPRLPALLALSALIFTAAPASAQKPPYTLTVTEHTTNKTNASAYTQTLREKRKHCPQSAVDDRPKDYL